MTRDLCMRGLLILLIAGCSTTTTGSQEQPTTPPAATPAATAVEPAATTSESTPAVADAGAASDRPARSESGAEAVKAAMDAVRGSVADVTPVLDSAGQDRTVRIVFTNTITKPCTVASYTLTWPGGQKTATPEASSSAQGSLLIPAGESRERTLRVYRSDGDISTLAAESAKVATISHCGP